MPGLPKIGLRKHFLAVQRERSQSLNGESVGRSGHPSDALFAKALRYRQVFDTRSHQRPAKRPFKNEINTWTLLGISLGEGKTAWMACSGSL